MAWVGVDLDGTLVEKQPEELGGGEIPIPGAVEAVTRYVGEGNRVTVFTARFAAMPESEKQRLKEQIEAELAQLGFPPLEVWTGTHKPDFDVYIGNEAITFDGDWGLAQAQADMMLADMGLSPQVAPDPNDPILAQGPEEEG